MINMDCPITDTSVCPLTQSNQNRLHKVGTKSLLVEHVADHRRDDFRTRFAVLSQLEHVLSELQSLRDRDRIGGQTGHANVNAGSQLVDLVEVHIDRAVLSADSLVAGDAHTVLAGHGNHRASVVLHNRHLEVIWFGLRSPGMMRIVVRFLDEVSVSQHTASLV